MIAAMSLYRISGLITKKCKIFQQMDSEKRDKCQIYIFEFIGLSVAMVYMLYAGTFNLIFLPQYYADIKPIPAHQLVGSLSGFFFVVYMVCGSFYNVLLYLFL